ncbi:hypothetical protein [Lactococcus garvieae]|uniref:Lipoprotein n=1 Tax=Lactococcus garvieae DCC43 TaxID=1231377 RepID=K2PHC4_9LACT|nr:hypothetical protein [Lactococcus garvieae]EKF50835.1 hypothetical protein C426_1760 [Lactococcus garvieae DCC43]
MKKFKLSLLVVASFAAALLLTACGNNANAKKDTTTETSSSVQSSSSDEAKTINSETETSESSATSTSTDSTASSDSSTATSEQTPASSTTESSDPGWVDNSNNPVENNGAGGHSPQTGPNASQPNAETDTSGHAWVLVYIDKAGNKHESTVSSSYKELQDKANALLASGEASSYYFIQK